MRPHERRILLTLVGDDVRTLPILFSLLQFRRRGEVFTHLVKRQITGRNLVNLYEESDYSPLKFYEGCIKKIDGLMIRPVRLKDLV